jgi:hypothetical protein
MLTFNQVWWSTRKICDRYFEPVPDTAGAAPPSAYDLLWECSFAEVAEERTRNDAGGPAQTAGAAALHIHSFRAERHAS